MSKNSAIIPFDFSKDYILEDDFVSLRPLEINDFNHLLTFALDEPEIWKYSLLSGAGEEGLKKYITKPDKRIKNIPSSSMIKSITPLLAVPDSMIFS